MFSRLLIHPLPQFDGAQYRTHLLNDPFDYTPDELVQAAYEDMIPYINSIEELQQGKMLGVLVVLNERCEVGYLAAHSGELMGMTAVAGFVPPIYNLDSEYFRAQESQITELNVRVKELEGQGGDSAGVESLRVLRRELSQQLQRRLFESYRVVNGRGEWSDIYSIFEERYHRLPPAATGECAAPKLLQYALLHNLKPLSMGEFWVGDSPRSELRRAGEFYGACRGRCYPLLSYMLRGVELAPVVEDLRRDRLFREDDLKLLYDEGGLLIFDKPAGMLSVRGLNPDIISVEDIVKERYGCDGAFMVHRLDQATSGILMVARTRELYVAMQGQFARRELTKRYVALLDGWLPLSDGEISLPLIADIYDRPRQMVNYLNF